MKKICIFISLFAFLLGGCDLNQETEMIKTYYSAGESFDVNIPSEADSSGYIKVHVNLPKEARYESGAPIIVVVPPYFTPDTGEPTELDGITELGFIEVTLEYPQDDYGGKKSQEALKDTILFAHLGLKDLISISPDQENVGLYAFSHPGIIATQVLAYYDELSFVSYFVGRENPTVDTISCMEIGYEKNNKAVINPLYQYPESYSPNEILIDYSSANYDFELQKPYFDLNNNGIADDGDYIFGDKVPTMFGKIFYSANLITSLYEKGVLTDSNWPENLVTLEEVNSLWPFRESVQAYSSMRGAISFNPEMARTFKVMLVFSKNDHVQVALDKPHIHQAYDGFTDAGLWVRMNPDFEYLKLLTDDLGMPDYTEHDANTEPSNWLEISEFAHSNKYDRIAPLAGVAEMADRTNANDWSEDLDGVLNLFNASL